MAASRLEWYIGLVALLAVAAVAFALMTAPLGPPLPVLGAALALTCAHLLPVPVRRGSEVETIGFEEAVLLPILLVVPAGGIMVGMLGSMLLWQLIVRQAAQKAIFNTAQMLLSLGAAAGMVAVISGTAPGDTGVGILAGVAGIGAMFVVNQLLVGGVLALASGTPLHEMLRDDLAMKGFIWIVNASLGLLLVPAMFLHPSLLGAALVLYVFVQAASRVYLRGMHVDAAISQLREATTALGGDVPLALIANQVARTAIQLQGGCGAQVRIAPGLRADTPPGVQEDLVFDVGDRGRLIAAVTLESSGVRIGELRVWRDTSQAAPPLVQRRRERAMLDLLARHASSALSRAAHAEDATRQRRTMAQVFEHSNEGLVVVDANGLVRAWNPAMAKLTGYDEQQVRFAPIALASTDLGRIVEADEAGVVDAAILTSCGETRIVRAAYAPIGGADVDRSWVIAVHDTTREREAERLKSDFVATVSHELRTPLTTIRGFLETLAREDIVLDSLQEREFIDIMRREAQRLDRLINDLLDSSAIEAGRTPSVRIRTVELEELVDATVTSFQAAHPGIAMKLQYPDGGATRVRVDPDRLQQVLLNLLENARRHGASTRPIELTISGERFGRVGIEVRDHGLGIGVEDQARIFERFYVTSDSVTRSGGGAGLGLFICRRLMLAMDGSIAVASERGRGAAFTLHLPCVASKVTPPRREPASAPVPAAPPGS